MTTENKKSIIVNFLEGEILQASQDGYYRNITEKHCFEIGKILANLHLASQGFKMKRKKIIFRPLSHIAEVTSPVPSLAKKEIPKWYKDIPRYVNNGLINGIKNPFQTKTVKTCVPFFDCDGIRAFARHRFLKTRDWLHWQRTCDVPASSRCGYRFR